MSGRIDRLERQLRRTRAVAGATVAVVASFVIGGACKDGERAATPQPTKLELREVGGDHLVTLDPTGITIESSKGTIHLAADAISARTAQQQATLSAASLAFRGDDGDTTLARGALTMKHGKHHVEVSATDEWARMTVDSEGMRRSASMIAGPFYATMSAVFMPEDGRPPHTGQLGSDKNGSELAVTDGRGARKLSTQP